MGEEENKKEREVTFEAVAGLSGQEPTPASANGDANAKVMKRRK